MANVGGLDRVLRFVFGVVLILVPFVAPSMPALAGLGNWGWLIGAMGVVMLLTAVFRFCPAYVPFGIRTCERE
ncbi:YgaP family membrane protein [Xanthobacter versatilis]|uniref:YgaP family membrane protein n=1 Tax=Xanthobacter autotrophicus (strain ATCC BAA-1158 / Py2) TaxID=78245 RepID=UPI00372BEEA4